MNLLSITAVVIAIAQSVDASNTKNTKCKTIAVRKEWSSLTVGQRRSYIAAVRCLQTSPSKLPAGLVPGASPRFDDFVATHVNKTIHIHLDGIFLSWHRQFVHIYEKTLQDECGYTGTQPYWDWSLYLGLPYNLTSSPLFDGSDSCLSNNGVYDPSLPPIIVGGGAVLPRGTGGECVTAGPFLNYTPSLGPFAFADVFTGSVPANWTVANPRCLERDLALLIAERYNNATAIKYLMATPDITAFQGNMSGADINAGVHGGGHYTLGGSGGDFFASPNDPAFWVHHGMIDKLWTEWQALDKPVRESALNGTNTIFDPPGATEVTLDYVQNWGYLSETRATREMMKVGYNGFCYRY